MSSDTPLLEPTPHGAPNESDIPSHLGTDSGLLVSLLTSMSEGINQTNTLLCKFMSNSKSDENIRKRALELDIDDRSDSPEEEDEHTSEPENSSRKHRKTTKAAKRAKLTTQEGQSQTTKIVKDPTETRHTSDVEVIQTSASGPDDTDRHKFCPDDLVSLFAGDDFNPSDEDTSDNADLLTDIDSALSSATEKGPPICEHLAKIVDQRLSDEIDRDKLKTVVSKYKSPQNCEELYLTKVNQEIWSQLPTHAKKADIRVANLQDTLLGGISASLISVNELLECRAKKTLPDYKGLITQLVDPIALTGFVCKELSYRRRDTLRPLLHKDFQQACSRTNKIGKMLFGDDLPKTIQDIKSTNRVMNTVAKPVANSSKNYSKPKTYTPATTSNTRSFLWTKGRHQYPPRKQYPQSQSQTNKNKFIKH